MEHLKLNVDGKEYDVKVEETEDGKLLVHCGKDTYEVETGHSKEAIYETLKKNKLEEKGTGTVASPLPGTVYQVSAKEGAKVKEGDSLIKLIAMKMENDITAPKSGTIKHVGVKKNDTVNKGDILAVIE
jgi:biotin carboxyl carrier protein